MRSASLPLVPPQEPIRVSVSQAMPNSTQQTETRSFERSSWPSGTLRPVLLELQRQLRANDVSISLNPGVTGKSGPQIGGIDLVTGLTELPVGEAVITVRYARDLSDSEMVSHSDVLTLEQLVADEIVVVFSATDEGYRIGVSSRDRRHARRIFEQVVAGLSLLPAS